MAENLEVAQSKEEETKRSSTNISQDVEKSQNNEDLSSLPFDRAFELTGHGKFNYAVLLTCGLIHLNVSMESVGMSYVITAAECDLHLSSEDKGFVNASAFIGIISTSFLWGYLGDSHGRRSVMLPAILLSTVFSILSSFSINVWMLVILRILTGCLVSASSATVYAYLGELHTSAHRSAAIAWGALFISFSFIALPGLAWLIIPGEWRHPISIGTFTLTLVPWRVLMLTWCMPGLAAAAALFFLPESPKFLLTRHGAEKALPVLAKMYAYNHGTTVDDFPVKKIMINESSNGGPEQNTMGFRSAIKGILLMFKPPLLRCMLIALVSIFAVFMLSSGMYMWVPDILNGLLSNTSNSTTTVCHMIHKKIEENYNATLGGKPLDCKTEVSVFPMSMGMGAVFALTYMAIGFLINRVGRKTLYCCIMAACGLLTIGACYVPHGAAAAGLLVLALCSGTAASILAAIAVDVFPTSMRAMAMCIIYMVGRLGAAFGAFILGILLVRQCEVGFLLFGVVTTGSTLLMMLWPNPEKVRAIMEKKGLTY